VSYLWSPGSTSSKDHDPHRILSAAPASALPAEPAPSRWPLRSYLELGALPTAVACARLHARSVLWEWGMKALAPDAELLVAELVINAVQATAARDQPAVRLRLSGDGARALIEVWDADRLPPAPWQRADGTPGRPSATGRGLSVVPALSTRWDWYLTREPPGRVIWCEIGP
jgi:anti-sigma regulatory factor (Ser/Thr protein kinase)